MAWSGFGPGASGSEASRCARIVGPLPVSHFQTRLPSSTNGPDDILQNQPGSDLVLADCIRFGPNGISIYRVPGAIKRRERELDPQVSSEEIMSREVELGCERWTSFASVVPQQQCNGHCLCDSAQHGS